MTPYPGVVLPTIVLASAVKRPSLLSQVLGINVLLVTLSVFVASVAAGLNLDVESQRWQFVVLATAIAGSMLVNGWVLRRRFRSLEHLIDTMEQVDLALRRPERARLARPTRPRWRA